MNDCEFRQVVSRWLELHGQLIELGRQRSQLQQELAEIKHPPAITTLDQLAVARRRRASLNDQIQNVLRQSRQLGDEMTKLEIAIRSELPQGVWYVHNGFAIQCQPHVKIQIKPACEVLSMEIAA